MWLCIKYFLCFFKILILIQSIKAKLIEPDEDIEKPIQYGCVNYDMAVELLNRVKSIENKVTTIPPGTVSGELSLRDHEKIRQNIKDILKTRPETQLSSSDKEFTKQNFRIVLETINESLKSIKEAQTALQHNINAKNPAHDDEVLQKFLQSLISANDKLADNLRVALGEVIQQQYMNSFNVLTNQTIGFQMQLNKLENNLENNLTPKLNEDLKNIIQAENLALKNYLNENSKQMIQLLIQLNDLKQTSNCTESGLKSELQEFIAKSIKDALKAQQKMFLESLQKQQNGENLKFSEKYLASATGVCNAKNGLPENCEEALRGNPQCSEGVYLLYVPGFSLEPFFAYCLPDYTTPSLPAWTIIQRRQSSYFSFLRGWNDYKDGFGDVHSSYWLGLKYIHALTSRQNYELRVDMEDWQGLKRFASYDKFVVGNEQNKFPLSLLGKYRGNAGDSLTIHSGQKFTTIDSDNDQRLNGNCAKDCAGGWWYVDCHVSNPNGIYNSTEPYKGIIWKSWHGYSYSFKKFSLAIRPKKA